MHGDNETDSKYIDGHYYDYGQLFTVSKLVLMIPDGYENKRKLRNLSLWL